MQRRVAKPQCDGSRQKNECNVWLMDDMAKVVGFGLLERPEHWSISLDDDEDHDEDNITEL